MLYVKIIFWIVLITLIFGFFHYTLPQHDIVRIINTEIRRVDLGENSFFWAQPDIGEDVSRKDRDVRFIEAFYENNQPMVYRNEDTSWSWPPYFKLNSANLQAFANDLKSTKENPQWVILRHYGWRNEFISIYPNIVNIRAVDSPDVRIIPWINITLLLLTTALLYTIWNRWQRFKRKRLEPLFEDISDNWAEREKGWFIGWLKRVTTNRNSR
ncbi:MAG: DUF1523 family protein [Aestuariivita sp.]|nr:DUF1523 family protein [Aestuariivita sp.]